MSQTTVDSETPPELKPFLCGLAVGGAVMVTTLLVACGLTASGYSRVWNLLIVAMGSFSIGMFIGFMLAAFGEENAKFSKTFPAITALLGGAALTDITAQNQNGMVLRTLRSLGYGCGLSSTALVGAVVVSFGSVGFFLMYTIKKLYLNRATAREDVRNQKILESASKTSQEIQTLVKSDQKGEDSSPKIPEPLKAKAEILANQLDTKVKAAPRTPEGTPIVFQQGILLFGAGKYDRAESCFRQVLESTPDHPEALYYQGYSLIQQGQESKIRDARSFLERARNAGYSDPYLDKLLGFTWLFEPNKAGAKDAETATKRYLEKKPTDPAALLNLACAYGQQGPTLAGNQTRLIAHLTALFQKHPEYKATVRGLMDGDNDFSDWKDDASFKTLVEWV